MNSTRNLRTAQAYRDFLKQQEKRRMDRASAVAVFALAVMILAIVAWNALA